MLKWVLILTLKMSHGKDQTSTYEDRFSTFEKCEKKGNEIIRKYGGAMKFKCEMRKEEGIMFVYRIENGKFQVGELNGEDFILFKEVGSREEARNLALEKNGIILEEVILEEVVQCVSVN